MENPIIQKVAEDIKKFNKEAITIKQTGFISNQIFIDRLIYNIEYDTLNLKDEFKGTYVTINLNQVYKVEKSNNELTLYIDNDTQITLII